MGKRGLIKLLIFSLSLIVIVIAVCGITDYNIAKSIPDAENCSPKVNIYDWNDYLKYRDSGNDTITINLEEKEHVSKDKYGFYNRIKFDKEVLVHIELSGENEKECKDVRFGIYEDNKLEKPIEEIHFIDWGDESFMEGELGIYEELSESEDGNVILSPGVYYLGVFTTNPKDDFNIEILGRYGIIENELAAKENQEIRTFLGDKKQETYIRTEHIAAEHIYVQCLADCDIQLCNERKEPITNTNHLKIGESVTSFNINKEGTYYIKISNAEIDSDGLPAYIKYSTTYIDND